MLDTENPETAADDQQPEEAPVVKVGCGCPNFTFAWGCQDCA